jgi:ATPase family protein associated with various cellular activities (AAA)/winged helix domain-containing protein
MNRPINHLQEASGEAAWQERNSKVVELGLAWLSSLLTDHVAALRAALPNRASNAPKQSPIGDLEADWLLKTLGRPSDFAPSQASRMARDAYEAARTAMAEAREPAQIDRLSAIFQLAPFDEDVLLLALAPRLEAGFTALCSYAHDRLSINAPTLHLALQLFAVGSVEATRLARARLSPTRPLRRFALIQGGDPAFSSLTPLGLDERVARYLAGEDLLDERVRPLLAMTKVGFCPDRHRAAVDRLAAQLRAEWRSGALLIGPQRSGRRAAARQLAAQFGLAVAELKPRAFPPEAEARQALLPVLAREAVLGDFALLVDATPATRAGDADTARLARQAAEELLQSFGGFVIVVSEERLDVPAGVPRARLAMLEPADRAALLRQELGPEAGSAIDETDTVAEHFRLGPDEIAAIAAELRTNNGLGLWRASREQASRGLDDLAERIEPRFGWNDIVLPEAVLDDLKAIAAQVRHRTQVYGRGGFGRKLARGRGITALFAGPSGVGKTMAAEVIARDLDLDLYRIDLSSVISKYIGETEQNLKRVFDAAEASGAVLFFDEADALFGKRSEVKDSHDRYANIEVSYLLQRMESYTGLAILATNLKGHLDPAFLRRLRFVIDVPFPDAAQRRAIWQQAFPPETTTSGLDYDALGRIDIAGGNIVVIAVNAAFLAAAEGSPVNMGHIARAARAELRKLDREFKPSWAAQAASAYDRKG